MKIAIALLMTSLLTPVYANETPISGQTLGKETAQTTNAETDGKVVCERKRIIGSNRTEKVCMTESDRIAAKQKAQQDLHRLGRCSGNDNICRGDL